ncbi:MAG: class I SAM-dependent methyltransferase [Elusimicrobiota bacterium]
MPPIPEKTAFYDLPVWYDLIHAEGTGDEVWLLERLFAAHGNGGRSWLEPACGTGRLLAGLARRGWELTGYDANERALAFARQRLKRWAGRVRLLKGRMETFKDSARFDCAFNLMSTFRHLLTDKVALAHLRSTAASLRPGGLYIIGLDLADYRYPDPDEETAYASAKGRKAWHVMMTLPAEKRRRRERILNFLTLRDKSGERAVESHYDLRSYDLREWKALLAKSPFRLTAVYNPAGRKTKLSEATRDAYFVLRK